MVKHYALTLDGTVQKLSSVLSDINQDFPLHFLSVQAYAGNSGVAFVGGSAAPAALSSTNYGFRIEIPVSSVPSAPNIVELSGGASTCLAEWVVKGTNTDKLAICTKD